MDVINDTETCHKNIQYAYEWTFYNATLEFKTRNFGNLYRYTYLMLLWLFEIK